MASCVVSEFILWLSPSSFFPPFFLGPPFNDNRLFRPDTVLRVRWSSPVPLSSALLSSLPFWFLPPHVPSLFSFLPLFLVRLSSLFRPTTSPFSFTSTPPRALPSHRALKNNQRRPCLRPLPPTWRNTVPVFVSTPPSRARPSHRALKNSPRRSRLRPLSQ